MEATLIKRYKRFLADVKFRDGSVATVHCPNTGSMKNCVEPGARIWLSQSSNPKRKYQYTWEFIETARGHTIGINTGKANGLVEEAIARGVVSELSVYSAGSAGMIHREVKYGQENSRIDLLLSAANQPDCYVEVKSVTLLEEPVTRGVGFFPDAVSDRGAKHLRELLAMKQAGFNSVLLFCVQHTGIQEVRPADHIDATYGELLRQCAGGGVQVLAYKCRRIATGFRLSRSLPVTL